VAEKPFGSIMNRDLVGTILMVLLVAATCRADDAARLVTITGETMGTIRYSVKLPQLPTGLGQEELQNQIDIRLKRLNGQMSTYQPDSEISRFNRYQRTDWFDVSHDTARVVDEALHIGRISDGAFDVTIAPLLKLWHFGPEAGGKLRIPGDDEITAAKARVGFAAIEVRLSPPALKKQRPDLVLELSGIAKGFAVDMLAKYLDSLDIRGYMIEIGGEMRTRGRKPDHSSWRVGIEAPTELERRVHTAIELTDASIATSGDYRAFYELDGKRYSHTIDPRTGKPIEFQLASVSVVADNCMHADAMATAIMVLGPDEGYKLAIARRLPVLLIVRKNGELVEKPTPQFQALLASKPEGSQWNTYLASLVIFVLAMLGMAIGVILSNRRIKGTCGGLAGLQDESGSAICESCTSPSETCQGIRDSDD